MPDDRIDFIARTHPRVDAQAFAKILTMSRATPMTSQGFA
jgi:hypothetical protein